jgi:polyisoprenoid-binding protein YceI
MSSHSGRYNLGPDNATLTVRTGRTGAAAKAGHNLEIRVAAWSAQLELDEDPAAVSLSLEVDSRSLKVLAGSGGMQALGDEDKANIETTINDEVFKAREIAFHSTSVHDDGSGGLHVHGELNLLGRTGPVEFTLAIAEDGHLSGSAEVVQTAFGIKPYSALFGTLKLTDEVKIEFDGRLPSQ